MKPEKLKICLKERSPSLQSGCIELTITQIGLEQYNARLVFRRDQQIEGLNFNETFSPVAKMVGVRTSCQ